jgi:argininosuccinate synthase
MATIQPRVTGAVRMKLFKGDCRVVGRRSPMALEAQAAAPATPASETTVH